MRQRLILLLLAALALPAAADGKMPKAKAVDMKASLAELDVYKDAIGHYYVVPRFSSVKPDEARIFYGDGKMMYRQVIVGSGSNAKHQEWILHAPRVKTMRFASLKLTAMELQIQCAVKDTRALTQLSSDQARKLLDKMTFHERFWQRQVQFIARDDDGIYYFVDRLIDEAGGGGYRVFVGRKGAMKEQAMTNIVNDSAGEIYATKAGELKIITENGKAFWKKGGKKAELVVLPPENNRYLMYRELGLYGQLGMVCDDL